jgi:hypothetical protein
MQSGFKISCSDPDLTPILHFLSIVLSVAMFGCASAADDGSVPARPKRDAWFKEPQSSSDYLHTNGGKLVGTARVFEVRPDSESEAEKQLDSVPILEIDVATANRMVGDSFRSLPGYTPFLTRGLHYSKPTGQWRIYELGDKLQVAHFSLGSGPADMHRQALVLLLKSKPAKVYTFCGGAQ